MLQQFIWKQKRILRGLYWSMTASGLPYDGDSSWWDKNLYAWGVSDRQTIAPNWSQLSSLYHYGSTEVLILRHLLNHAVQTRGISVLDIGSGAGHWIKFWQNLGAKSVDGLDVSSLSVKYLRSQFLHQGDVRIHHGPAKDVMEGLNQSFSVVNAIGVMFHIVDDDEWLDTISAVAKSLKPGGLFVIGGHFGWLNKINVQIDANARINKRLRSKRHWISALRKAGFDTVDLYRNNAYLHIRGQLPENNILIARKAG